MTAAMGISHSAASLEVLGTFHVDIRRNLGEELPDKVIKIGLHARLTQHEPWSIATKSVVDSGTWLLGRVMNVFPSHISRSASTTSIGDGIWVGSMAARSPTQRRRGC